ncbi:hypothetical protein [Mycobacterium persicum]|uniref:hypothetical protein n=1 Tax=Mycobacterium persicum TaxID=1487726 RepID=UPI001592E319|nr:hypothetical protein [Mycobacterium persicum]
MKALAKTTAKHDNIEDALDQAFVRRMQQRGIIGDVPGMPEQTDPDQERWDRMLAWAQAQKEIQEKAEAKKSEAENPLPETAAEMIRCALTGANSPTHLPLNGAGVLRAALSGMGGRGTIKGGSD